LVVLTFGIVVKNAGSGKTVDKLEIFREDALSHSRKSIDTSIRRLIADLNKAGHETQSSCQGKRRRYDVITHNHCNHAFITFMPFVPNQFRRAIKRAGLKIFNGDMSITSLDGSEANWEDIFQKNKAFETRIRQAFKL